jgi:hypothetical protein
VKEEFLTQRARHHTGDRTGTTTWGSSG